METQVKVLLNTVEKVCWFCNVVQQVFVNASAGCVVVEQDRYCVSGGSVMGIFSLNLTRPLKVRVSSQYAALVERFLESIQEVIVK